MAPRKTIYKAMILDGAIAVIETLGYERLSVRNIANQLKISTQPVYTEFKNIEDLKQQLVRYIQKNYIQVKEDTYKDFALCFLYFAKEHRELFKFMYLRKRKGNMAPDDANYDQAIMALAEALLLPLAIAEELHQRMQLYCYSLGVMIATSYQDYSYERIEQELSDIFRIMLYYYKKITSEEEFAYWIEKTRHLHIR